MNNKQYTNEQLYQIGRMLIEELFIDNLECIQDKENRNCRNEDCYECIFNQYALSIEENCYTDELGDVHCKHCKEKMVEGYCKCNK